MGLKDQEEGKKKSNTLAELQDVKRRREGKSQWGQQMLLEPLHLLSFVTEQTLTVQGLGCQHLCGVSGCCGVG